LPLEEDEPSEAILRVQLSSVSLVNEIESVPGSFYIWVMAFKGVFKYHIHVWHYIVMQVEESMGAFHSAKNSGNSGTESNGTEIFAKFVSRILVNLSKLSLFREFSVPLGIPFR